MRLVPLSVSRVDRPPHGGVGQFQTPFSMGVGGLILATRCCSLRTPALPSPDRRAAIRQRLALSSQHGRRRSQH